MRRSTALPRALAVLAGAIAASTAVPAGALILPDPLGLLPTTTTAPSATTTTLLPPVPLEVELGLGPIGLDVNGVVGGDALLDADADVDAGPVGADARIGVGRSDAALDADVGVDLGGDRLTGGVTLGGDDGGIDVYLGSPAGDISLDDLTGAGTPADGAGQSPVPAGEDPSAPGEARDSADHRSATSARSGSDSVGANGARPAAGEDATPTASPTASDEQLALTATDAALTASESEPSMLATLGSIAARLLPLLAALGFALVARRQLGAAIRERIRVSSR